MDIERNEHSMNSFASVTPARQSCRVGLHVPFYLFQGHGHLSSPVTIVHVSSHTLRTLRIVGGGLRTTADLPLGGLRTAENSMHGEGMDAVSCSDFAYLPLVAGHHTSKRGRPSCFPKQREAQPFWDEGQDT